VLFELRMVVRLVRTQLKISYSKYYISISSSIECSIVRSLYSQYRFHIVFLKDSLYSYIPWEKQKKTHMPPKRICILKAIKRQSLYIYLSHQSCIDHQTHFILNCDAIISMKVSMQYTDDFPMLIEATNPFHSICTSRSSSMHESASSV